VHTKGWDCIEKKYSACVILIHGVYVEIEIAHWHVLNNSAHMGFRRKDSDKMVQNFHEVVS
jgi:hypothetical protein